MRDISTSGRMLRDIGGFNAGGVSGFLFYRMLQWDDQRSMSRGIVQVSPDNDIRRGGSWGLWRVVRVQCCWFWLTGLDWGICGSLRLTSLSPIALLILSGLDCLTFLSGERDFPVFPLITVSAQNLAVTKYPGLPNFSLYFVLRRGNPGKRRG